VEELQTKLGNDRETSVSLKREVKTKTEALAGATDKVQKLEAAVTKEGELRVKQEKELRVVEEELRDVKAELASLRAGAGKSVEEAREAHVAVERQKLDATQMETLLEKATEAMELTINASKAERAALVGAALSGIKQLGSHLRYSLAGLREGGERPVPLEVRPRTEEEKAEDGRRRSLQPLEKVSSLPSLRGRWASAGPNAPPADAVTERLRRGSIRVRPAALEDPALTADKGFPLAPAQSPPLFRGNLVDEGASSVRRGSLTATANVMSRVTDVLSSPVDASSHSPDESKRVASAAAAARSDVKEALRLRMQSPDGHQQATEIPTPTPAKHEVDPARDAWWLSPKPPLPKPRVLPARLGHEPGAHIEDRPRFKRNPRR